MVIQKSLHNYITASIICCQVTWGGNPHKELDKHIRLGTEVRA
nr:MAG TPA: hypothetical protein [Caudoviricetes sp.]